MKTFMLDPTKIKLRKGMKRFREDDGEILKLHKSIKRFGQLQPIVITEKFELVAGGRRLAACRIDGMQILCMLKKNLDNLTLRLIELEENLQRKDFTPAEECQAVAKIHKLKIEQYGDARKFSQSSGQGWDAKKTAALLGISQATVCNKMQQADMVEHFPTLAKAKTQSELKFSCKAISKRFDRVLASQTVSLSGLKSKSVRIEHQNALEFMQKLPDNSINLLLTDPPYGIDIQDIAQSAGSTTGKTSTSGYKFDDSKDNALMLYTKLAEQSYRFTKETAHAFVFVAAELFPKVQEIFNKASWLCHVKPIIWIKEALRGQCNAPHAWPSSSYDMILYARKQASRLVIEGRVDWFQCNPVQTADRTHPTEKPVPLLEELINRTCLPGATLTDPFMGSGSALHAGVRCKLVVSGCDISGDAVASAKVRIDRYFKSEEKKNG